MIYMLRILQTLKFILECYCVVLVHLQHSLTPNLNVIFRLNKLFNNGFNYTLALNQVLFPFLQKANNIIKDISIEWKT